MPIISIFHGLIVSMYYFDYRRHSLAHIHVNFGEMEAVYTIPDGILLEGGLTLRKEKILLEWINLHKGALLT